MISSIAEPKQLETDFEFKAFNERMDFAIKSAKFHGINFIKHMLYHTNRRWEYAKAAIEIKKLLGEDIKAVDVGGAGTPFGFTVVGEEMTITDILKEKLEIAQNFAKIVNDFDPCVDFKIQYDDITETRLPKQYFDAVFCISVIEHIPHNKHVEALSNMEYILKPKGVLALSFDYGRHKNLYSIMSPEEINYKLNKAGLKMIGEFDHKNFDTKRGYTFAVVFARKK